MKKDIDLLLLSLYQGDSSCFKELMEQSLDVLVQEMICFDSIAESDYYDGILFLIGAIKNYCRKDDFSYLSHASKYIHLSFLILKESKREQLYISIPYEGNIFIPSLNVTISHEEIELYVSKLKQKIEEEKQRIPIISKK